jgi:catechol 1,2-dioxygenase
MKHDAGLGRRIFLGGVGGLVVTACGSAADLTPNVGGAGGGSGGQGQGGSGGQPGVGGAGAAGGSGPLDCTPTADNILGPYYRAGAPFADDLTTPDMEGTRFHLSGTVLDPDCQPIAGAVLDFWQADDDGSYDNDGVNDPPAGEYVLRGKVATDAAGGYSLKTIIPGHYLNGNQYRPAHIHVRVSAPGFSSLTTQLYFEGDPYNDIDPFIIDSLIMLLSNVGDAKAAVFDFVLPPA